MSRWSQFVAMTMAQLSGRCSLRDVVANLEAQKQKLYHLGVGRVARSSLSRVNQEQPHELFELQFNRLLDRCRGVAPGHRFRFKNPLLSLDATIAVPQTSGQGELQLSISSVWRVTFKL